MTTEWTSRLLVDAEAAHMLSDQGIAAIRQRLRDDARAQIASCSPKDLEAIIAGDFLDEEGWRELAQRLQTDPVLLAGRGTADGNPLAKWPCAALIEAVEIGGFNEHGQKQLADLIGLAPRHHG